MSQGNDSSKRLVSLNAGNDHDIVITGKNTSSVITVGAIQGTNPNTESSLKLVANNITVNAPNGTAVNVYDTQWQTADKYHPGTTSVDIKAANTLTLNAKTYGLLQRRSTDTNSSSSTMLISATTVNITAGSSAIKTTDTSDGVSSKIDLKADCATFTSTDAKSNDGALETGSNTELTIQSLNGSQSSSVYVSAANGKAMVINGTASATQANISIVNGSVTGTGNLALTNSDIELSEESTIDIGTITANNSSVTVNAVGENTIKIGTLNANDKALKLKASSTLNDQYAGRSQELVTALKTSNNISDHLAYGADEGLISGAIGQDENGNIVVSNNSMTSAYEQFNNFGFVQWRNQNNHISQRLGDVRNSRGAVGAWARVYGSDSTISDKVSTDVRSTTIQVGLDSAINDNWIVGGALSYTDSRAEFDMGQGDADGYAAAVYASGFFDCGGFIDVIGRVGRISTDMTVLGQTAGNAFTASFDNTALGLSAEIGYRLPLSQTFYAEPQFELTYGYVMGDDFSTSQGVSVEQDDYHSLTARLGAQLGAKFAEDRGTVYLHASVNHDFLGDVDSSYRVGSSSSIKAESDLGGTWISYGVGFQFNTTANLNLYGSLERANGNDYQDDYRYSVGVRYVW